MLANGIYPDGKSRCSCEKLLPLPLQLTKTAKAIALLDKKFTSVSQKAPGFGSVSLLELTGKRWELN